MEKYKTKANKAEEQIHKLLSDNKSIHRPWGLVKNSLVNRTLDCTASEVKIIYVNNSNVRPGFEIVDNIVFLPNLFVKFSGIDDNTKYFQKFSDLKSQSNTFIYENFKGFCDGAINDFDLSPYINIDGTIKKELILQSDNFKFSFLRREYQILIVDKIETIIKNKKDLFISRAANLSDEEILYLLLNVDIRLITAFNEFDFSLKPPAIIIENNKKSRVTRRQAVSLILLNQLGFDIIAISGNGFADIENVLSDELYTLFYGEKISKRSKLKRRTKILITAASVILSAGIALASILPGLSNQTETPDIKPQDNQEVVDDITGTDNNDSGQVFDDAAANDSTDATNPENPDAIEGIILEYTSEEGKNYMSSIIDVYINDPDGNPIDMTQVSYTINRGGTTVTKNLFYDHDGEWRDGPRFSVSSNEERIQIHAQEDGTDFYYVISADTEEYSFLFEGKLSKDHYINNRRIDLTFNMQGVEKTHLSANTGNDLVSTVNFYIFSSDDEYNPIDEDFNRGCHGTLRISSGKEFYSNLPNIDLFMYYTVYDGFVFYTSRPNAMASPEISARMDKNHCLKKTLTISPGLTDFPYYVSHVIYPGADIYIKGTIPSSNKITLYSNSTIPSTNIVLSKDPTDIYVSGLAGIKLNDDNVFGFDARITEFFVQPEDSNIVRLETRFTDSFFNTFAYLGYSHDGEKPGIYDYSMEISKDGKILLTKTMSPYDAYIEISLADGTYDVEVKPAYDNTLYYTASYFTMIVNNDLNERVSFNLRSDK